MPNCGPTGLRSPNFRANNTILLDAAVPAQSLSQIDISNRGRIMPVPPVSFVTDHFVMRTRSAGLPATRSSSQSDRNRTRYGGGPPLCVSFIWGFETIPIVATIGPRGKYHGSNWIPRMLAWSCPSILQYTKLATTIFDRKDYTVKNELRPTKEELQQTYMKTFWHRPSDRKYYGPPVFRVEASKSQLPVLPQLPIDGTKDASQSAFQHTSRLEMQIEEIRSELPLSNMPVVPVWDPFTPIDPAERAALSAFIDDPSTTVHPGDYDALEEFVSTDFDKWIMVR
ncbi:hypothetical protein FNV43_RR15905 [Rhamnella rubrinervis]|uniref:Uncharacterized protein n=1 Tax=Rhamnella rubrinervis TaxID=2594499 RepID=A0A8K0E9S7_9ROSA|nr:hypothetical protein FNV43_RR15905 [Rhamnella rubrinervis]